MIELKSTRVTDQGYAFTVTKLLVDGEVLDGATVREPRNEEGLHGLYAYRPERAAARIRGIPLDQLSRLFDFVSVQLGDPVREFFGRVELSWSSDEEMHPTGLTFWPTVRLNEWAKPYSAAELSEAVRLEVGAHPEYGASFHQNKRLMARATPAFALKFEIDRSCSTIDALVEQYSPAVVVLFDSSVDRLIRAARRDSLVTFFEFPKSVRIACQQYLLYFVQFLADLGIDADAELKEDAHRILFAVTPRDGAEALGRIQEALDAYVSIPGSGPVRDLVAGTQDIAQQQLAAQVMHLESQLALARAVDQARTATIENLQLSNFQYRQMLIQMPVAPQTQKCLPDEAGRTSESDREEFLDGTIAVTSYKAKGVEVNIPKIIRMLKRRFS